MKKINSWQISLSIVGIIAIVLLLIPTAHIQAATGTIPLCEITRTLKVGSQGDDVRCLQRYLNWQGYSVAQTGVGSPGNESQYFGTLTANAVKRWQDANAAQVLLPAALSSGTGIWGKASFNYYVSLVNTALGVSH